MTYLKIHIYNVNIGTTAVSKIVSKNLIDIKICYAFSI